MLVYAELSAIYDDINVHWSIHGALNVIYVAKI